MLIKLQNVKAPMPLMHPDAAEAYNRLREETLLGAGFDFLAVCGDVARAANFVSTKDGVANRSWHKTGRAFDYNQESPFLVVVSEPRGTKQYFRTYLRCRVQDGSIGKKMTALKDWRGNLHTGYYFDFIEAAERIGFKRIPAWTGWRQNYIRMEFWHYQFDQGLTWDEAMQQLKPGKAEAHYETSPDDRIAGLNDRGEVVRRDQERLALLGYLPKTEIDGVFGAKTRSATCLFQRNQKLAADGSIGPDTRKASIKALVNK